MDCSTKTSERITAILSTIVAVGLLAAGVTAQQSRSARTDELVHLESDLRFQLQSVFRLNPKEGAKRLEKLEAVLASWQETPQTADDRRLLADWLLEATVRSMPGSDLSLPPAPQFGQKPAEEALPSPHAVGATPQHSAGDLLAAEADELDQPSKFTPVVAVSAVPVDSPVELAEELLVTPTPMPQELPPVEATPQESAPLIQPASVQVAEPVEINLTELTARITGYHRGLDEIEAYLLVHERPQFENLSQQIKLLDSLTKDFHFVRLYYESLTPDERHRVQPPRSMTATLAELRRHLDRLQHEVEADFLGEYDADMSDRLAQLRSQLDAIDGRTDW